MVCGLQEHFYLEPNASIVVPGEADEMLSYSSTQASSCLWSGLQPCCTERLLQLAKPALLHTRC